MIFNILIIFKSHAGADKEMQIIFCDYYTSSFSSLKGTNTLCKQQAQPCTLTAFWAALAE